MNRVFPTLSAFPEIIPAGTAKPEKYQRLATHFAVHRHQTKPDDRPTLEFEPERIAVFPIERYKDLEGTESETTPVYSLAKNGRLAVPTGKIFVRLAPNLKFETLRESFQQAGYEVDQTLSYAPNAGWLRPTASSVASALSGLSKLAVIPGVENVEPQMLSQRATKT